MHHRTMTTKALLLALVLAGLSGAFGAWAMGPLAKEPVDPWAFDHARLTDAWQADAGVLTVGKGKAPALADAAPPPARKAPAAGPSRTDTVPVEVQTELLRPLETQVSPFDVGTATQL